MNDVDYLAGLVWDYHKVHHVLQPSDGIVVLGSRDTRPAERGAQLLLDGWAPILVMSGGLGTITRQVWNTSEADRYAEIAVKMGVPRERMLIENKSTNTNDNVAFTKELLSERHIALKRLIVVHKPYMERRSYALFRKQWPEIEVIVTSPHTTLENYYNSGLPKDQVISVMIGDLQRIKVYAEKGFQIPQEVPEEVWDAYLKLVKLGYTKYLLDEENDEPVGALP